MKPAHGLSVGLGLQNNGYLPCHQLVPGDILELGHVRDKMGIQMVMRPQLRFLNSGCMLCKCPRLKLALFDFLCHLDFFAEESESEEDVTDDSPGGSSDD